MIQGEHISGAPAPDADSEASSASDAAVNRDRGRKFLVVVDSTPECHNALRFAARRAAHTGGGVAMLYVVPQAEEQVFMMVNQRMREEARTEAEDRLRELAEQVRAQIGVLPEIILREGAPEDCVLALLSERPDMRVLVLGAAAGSDGPGPLVTALAGRRAGQMPAPVTVVPGAMSIEDVDAIT